ncbi:MAG: iron ABC transporter permease [Actinomycetota bacterium]|jgi:iron(III) transport system permease protein|nr:iron ABC transporter permease [Actinomycetota bacterium]
MTATALAGWLHGRRRRLPLVLAATSVVVVALLLAPLGLVLAQAGQSGWATVWSTLDRPFVATLLWNTVRLALAVTALAALVGTVTAWLTERTALAARRAWAVLLVLPVVMPDFVLAWTWSSMFPGIHGYWGAVLVMTLHLYPLVYLPMAAAFRVADPGQEEMARALGLSRLQAWWKVSVRQARSTLLGGSLLVCLALLAYYGAFEDLRYQTFTTAIFGELETQFDPGVASSLSLVLVALSVLVLGAEAGFRERGKLQRSGPMAERAQRPLPLGRAKVPALAAVALVAVPATGFPVFVVAYWMLAGGSSTLPTAVSLGAATAYTAVYSALGAALATALALPVSLLAARHQRKWSGALERATFITQAVPGIVVALALVYLASHFLGFLYQSPELLVFAYAVMFFPLGLVAMAASVARASPRLEEVGRSLGQGPMAVRLRVTLPLVAPGLVAAFCFVFLSAATELTATLLLVPTGAGTLATQFWADAEQGVAFGSAAPYAAMMMLLSAAPAYLLGRWFDRGYRSSRGSRPAFEVVA